MIPTTKMLSMMSVKDRKTLGKAGKLPEEIAAEQLAKSEKELQEQIAGYMRRHEIWNDRDAMHVRRTGTKGAPDFLFAHHGIAMAFEVKMPGQKPTDEQLRCHAAMRRNGWDVYIITSLSQAIEVLEKNTMEHGLF